MIEKIHNLNFYELLEVSPTATTREIHKAYERVRKIYDPNSIALYSLFSPEETALMQQRIEEAYRTLVYEDKRRLYDASLKGGNEGTETMDLFAPSPAQPQQSASSETVEIVHADPATRQVPFEAPEPEEVKPAPVFTGEFTGPAIRSLREQSGLDLRAIADLTRVSIRYLGFIEEENFSKLPARTYIRGFLQLYARALGCDAGRLSSDYLKRYDAAVKPAKAK